MINSVANGVHFYAMDGNGNVAALVKGTDGTVSARYEYDPFGQTIRATGTMALENPYRFSTKRTDNTSDLILYEYRAYSPSLGRWLNRDPLGERGGNLYAFVSNNPESAVDPDGREGFVPYPGYPGPLQPPTPPALEPNQGGVGNVHHSQNTLKLSFSPCCSCDALVDDVFNDLKSFKYWGKNSVAGLTIADGIGSFLPKGLPGFGGGFVNNDSTWRVRFSQDESSHCITARTLDNHPLVGVRKWCASANKKGGRCAITVTTEAYERPRNLANELGAALSGNSAQIQIWEDYFGNIAEAYKGNGCFKSSQRGSPISEPTGSKTNPWLA
jgi:RHS repeat-associated protein